MNPTRSIEPAILYFGTPVVLLSTLNEDGSANLAPMSSVFWLGWRCLIGLDASSHSPANLLRSGECVLNLPSQAQAGMVDRIALTTGSDPVPARKARRGYRTVREKFAQAGASPLMSETVAAPRVAQCPVQLEAKLERVHPVGALREGRAAIQAFELRITRVHAHESICAAGETNRIDPLRWRPLIMSFQRFFGLGAELDAATLASVPEAMYRSPEVDRAREEALVQQAHGEPQPHCARRTA